MTFFLTSLIDPEWDSDDWSTPLIERVRQRGRLDVADTMKPASIVGGVAAGWEASEAHCAKADRSRSVWFTDEAIARRRTDRARRLAALREHLRREREATLRRRRAEKRRAEQDQVRRVVEQEEQLSVTATRVLSCMLQVNQRWSVQGLALLLHTSEEDINRAVYELVLRGKLRRVPTYDTTPPPGGLLDT